MFRALLAHLQEALHKRYLYCVRVMSVDCDMVALQLCHSQLTLYAQSMKSASHWFQYTDML
jgi:hypothetical protein